MRLRQSRPNGDDRPARAFEEKVAELGLSVDESEGYGIKSLGKGDEKLALNVPANIAEL